MIHMVRKKWFKVGPCWFNSVQSLSCVRLAATSWTAAHQASLSITNSWSLLKLMSIESVMPSNHLILGCPLLLVDWKHNIGNLTKFCPWSSSNMIKETNGSFLAVRKAYRFEHCNVKSQVKVKIFRFLLISMASLESSETLRKLTN